MRFLLKEKTHMAEPFMGSQWPSFQVPAFGYSPSLLTQVSRSPNLFSSITAPAAPPVPGPVADGMSAFASPEIAVGVTAPALLATVAMRRGQPFGPTNDHEIEDFIYDALDLIPGTSDVEVRCEAGRATFTGSVPHKRVKRDIGEIAWAIPTLTDVQNNIMVAARRRSRPPYREAEAPTAAGVRKPA
jgi:hypothetical protein